MHGQVIFSRICAALLLHFRVDCLFTFLLQGKFVDTEGVVWSGTFHNGAFFNGKTFITLR